MNKARIFSKNVFNIVQVKIVQLWLMELKRKIWKYHYYDTDMNQCRHKEDEKNPQVRLHKIMWVYRQLHPMLL